MPPPSTRPGHPGSAGRWAVTVAIGPGHRDPAVMGPPVHRWTTTLRPFAAAAFLLGGLASGPAVPAPPPTPQLSSDTAVASAGFFQLRWTSTTERVELQEAGEANFRDARVYYTGPDRATVISGRPDGAWHYRIRTLGEDGPGPWSAPVTVTVAHHPLTRALMFFGLGVLIFTATLALIVRGEGRDR